jgi:hypothetical protein
MARAVLKGEPWCGDWDYRCQCPAVLQDQAIAVWFEAEGDGDVSLYVDNVFQQSVAIGAGMRYPDGTRKGHFDVKFRTAGDHTVEIRGKNTLSKVMHCLPGSGPGRMVVERPPGLGFPPGEVAIAPALWCGGVQEKKPCGPVPAGQPLKIFYAVTGTALGRVSSEVRLDGVHFAWYQIDVTDQNLGKSQPFYTEVSFRQPGDHTVQVACGVLEGECRFMVRSESEVLTIRVT